MDSATRIKYLKCRIADLAAQHKQQMKISSDANALVHALSGALQEARYGLEVEEGRVIAVFTDEAAGTGIGADVSMDAEVTHAAPAADGVTN